MSVLIIIQANLTDTIINLRSVRKGSKRENDTRRTNFKGKGGERNTEKPRKGTVEKKGDKKRQMVERKNTNLR